MRIHSVKCRGAFGGYQYYIVDIFTIIQINSASAGADPLRNGTRSRQRFPGRTLPCPTIGHGMCKLRFPQLSRFCPVLPHERKSFRSPYPPSHPCILQGFFAVTASLFPARTDLSSHSQQRMPCMKVKGKIVYWTDH